MKSLTCPIISTVTEDDYRSVIRYTFAGGKGPNIIFSLGSTGEANYLPLGLKKELIAIAADEVRELKKIKHNSGRTLELAVGITGRGIDETMELAQYAEQQGADYAVLMPIYITRNKRTEEFSRKIGDNVRTVLDKTKKIEFILYNFPLMTGNKNIRKATWGDLARYDRIVGIKDSSGDPVRVRSYIKYAGGFAQVDVGNEILGLEMNKGRIVAGSTNILPVPWNMAVFEDRDENYFAVQTAEKLVKFQRIYKHNPIGAFKYLLHKLGIISSPQTFNRDLRVSTSFAGKLDSLLLDKDFQTMHQACLA